MTGADLLARGLGTLPYLRYGIVELCACVRVFISLLFAVWLYGLLVMVPKVCTAFAVFDCCI